MKTKNILLNFTFYLLLFVLLTIGSCGEKSSKKNSHHDESHKTEHNHEGGHHEGDDHAFKIPDTLPLVWKEVLKINGEIEETIKIKKLENVHPMAPKIADLIKAMEGKSGGLNSDNLTKLIQSTIRVKTVTDLLHEYSDKNDLENTIQQFERLKKLLNFIKELYTADMLKIQHESNEEHDH